MFNSESGDKGEANLPTLSGTLHSEPGTRLSDKLNLELGELERGGRFSSKLGKMKKERANSLLLSKTLNSELKTQDLASGSEQRRKGG